MVLHSATVWHGGAPVPNGVDILSQYLVVNLIAAAAVVVARVDQAPVPATSTLKKPGPTEHIKVTLSVLHHAVKITKMAYGYEACDSTEYLANKQNGNVKQVIFRFLPPNFQYAKRHSGKVTGVFLQKKKKTPVWRPDPTFRLSRSVRK